MLLTEQQVRDITDLKKPTAQARKLSELGFVVLGYSARGRVRALAEHPLQDRKPATQKVRMRL